jgi:hypothetical protein
MDTDNEAINQAAQEYVTTLVESAAKVRIPDIFAKKRPDAIYYLPNRQGVSVTVVRTGSMTEDELINLLKYRLAQYIAVGFVDPLAVYAASMQHEPLSHVAPDDIHYIAGSNETGEILCYMTLRAAPKAPPDTTLKDYERPLFPVEKLHGWGIFNQLRILPDMPIAKIRELGRFVKNHQLHTFDELGTRAPIEIGVAFIRTLTGPLRSEVDAFVLGMEENVAKQNLDFFHIPNVVIHGTVPYATEDDFLYQRYPERAVYPCAVLVSDMEMLLETRLPSIEAALELPGKQGMLALFSLKRDAPELKSSLIPRGGLGALAEATVPQKGVPMEARRQLLFRGDVIREFDPFAGMSVAEAATLGSFMERVDVGVGEAIVKQGEEGDAIYLIEAGRADVQVHRDDGGTVKVSQLEAGDYFGEIGLLTGGPRTADVVATTPMKLLKLSRDTYMRYLAERAEIERQIAMTATKRAADTMKKL